MKLGVNTHFIMKFSLEEGLKFCQDLEVKLVEVAAMGPSAKKYCDVEKLLADEGERKRWLDMYAGYGLEVYSFSGHGTPLVPDQQIASEFSRQFLQACQLMEKIGCTRMALVAGLPEAAEGDTLPAWIVNTDLPIFRDALEWQWQKRLLPFWREHGKIASDHGVTLCFEMQVNDMIHNPVKLRRLRDELGEVVACNFDISHMWVQRIDPFEAIHYLGDLIQNVHLKDNPHSRAQYAAAGTVRFDRSPGLPSTRLDVHDPGVGSRRTDLARSYFHTSLPGLRWYPLFGNGERVHRDSGGSGKSSGLHQTHAAGKASRHTVVAGNDGAPTLGRKRGKGMNARSLRESWMRDLT